MSQYGLTQNYVLQQEEIVKDMTLESIKMLANDYLHPEKMIYLVVGDAKTQFERLKELGLGEPILLNP